MASPESSLDQPVEPTIRQTVLDVLRQQRAENPEHTSALARHLWSSLSPEEQDFRSQAIKDDLAAEGIDVRSEGFLVLVGAVSRTLLLAEYEDAQVRQAEELSAQFSQPTLGPESSPAA